MTRHSPFPLARHLTGLRLSARLLGAALATASVMALPVSEASAVPAPSLPAASAATPVTGLYNALEKAQTEASAESRASLIGSAVDQAFDLETILRRSIGLHYEQLTPPERTALLQAFRRFTIARYVSSFKPGSEAAFTVSPTPVSNPTGGVMVDTTIRGKGDRAAPATPINYVMTQTPQGWRITDILLDGHISQTAAQRSDFRSIIDQSGPSGLTHTLDKKADGLLHG